MTLIVMFLLMSVVAITFLVLFVTGESGFVDENGK